MASWMHLLARKQKNQCTRTAVGDKALGSIVIPPAKMRVPEPFPTLRLQFM
jgi:hypothetical protein